MQTNITDPFWPDNAQSHPGVTFMRKVDIANYAIASVRTVREGI